MQQKWSLSAHARLQRGVDVAFDSRCDSELKHSGVRQRIAQYETSNRPETVELRKWENDYFHPLVDRLCAENRLGVLYWDETLEAITKAKPSEGTDLKRFYERCLSVGAPPPDARA
jgi:hypothetical protein